MQAREKCSVSCSNRVAVENVLLPLITSRKKSVLAGREERRHKGHRRRFESTATQPEVRRYLLQFEPAYLSHPRRGQLYCPVHFVQFWWSLKPIVRVGQLCLFFYNIVKSPCANRLTDRIFFNAKLL